MYPAFKLQRHQYDQETMNMSTRLKISLPLSVLFLLIVFTKHAAFASEDLWSALKEGGKVVLMRHAPVERGTESGNPLLRDPSCKQEKKLSSLGKRNAALVGNRFRERNIPVSKVMHSPFCRTTDTAESAFGLAYPANYLSLLEILSSEEAAQQSDELNRVMGSYRGEGNLILVTHEPNISAVSFELLRHLDFLVIKPTGDASFEELGVVRFSE